jgi:acetyltransferase-like isoleucine patch superfamily enzyme
MVPYRVASWRRQLQGRVSIGRDTRLVGASLVVRDALGCSIGIGEGSDIAAAMVLEAAGARIQIGQRTHVGGETLLDSAEEIVIGDDVLIAFGTLIMDHDSHSLEFDHRRHDVGEWIKGRKDWSHVPRSPVHIDDKVWVGTRAIVLKGVHLGVGSVVAAGAVVTHDVPPWMLVAGCPAHIVRDLSKADSAVASSPDE